MRESLGRKVFGIQGVAIGILLADSQEGCSGPHEKIPGMPVLRQDGSQPNDLDDTDQLPYSFRSMGDRFGNRLARKKKLRFRGISLIYDRIKTCSNPIAPYLSRPFSTKLNEKLIQCFPGGSLLPGRTPLKAVSATENSLLLLSG